MCHAGKDFKAAVMDLGRGGGVEAQNWRGERFYGTPSEMSINRRVESTDDREGIHPVSPGEW